MALSSTAVASSSSSPTPPSSSSSSSSFWPAHEVSALARAMAKHPGGTPNRWERITAVVNAVNDATRTGRQRTVKEVLARVKVDEARAAMRGSDERPYDASLQHAKKAANGAAPASTESVVPARTEADAVAGKDGGKEKKPDEWSGTEQGALEAALRSVSRDADDRWEQIAAVVVTKTKRQCIARFKQIRAEITASKGADASTA